MTVDQIMAADSRIDTILGSTKHVVARDSKQFGKEIAKYIDSRDQRRGDDKDKKKGGEKDKKKAAPAKSSGNALMDLVRKKTAAQASVLQTGTNVNASSSGSNATAGGGTREVNIEDLELWPLIKSVKVRCKSAALNTGSFPSS